MSETNCPHCGEPEETDTPSDGGVAFELRCGVGMDAGLRDPRRLSVSALFQLAPHLI